MKKLIIISILLCFVFSLFVSISDVQAAVTKIKPAYTPPVREIVYWGNYFGEWPHHTQNWYGVNNDVLNPYFTDEQITQIENNINANYSYSGNTFFIDRWTGEIVATTALNNFYFKTYSNVFYSAPNCTDAFISYSGFGPQPTAEQYADALTKEIIVGGTPVYGDLQVIANYVTIGYYENGDPIYDYNQPIYVNVNGIVSISGGTHYKIVDYQMFSPIVLDLAGLNIIDASNGFWYPHLPQFFTKRTVIFDIDGDGMTEFIEWVGPKAGILVKPNADGTVTSGHNMFGTAGGYKDGYEKMSEVLDKDKNGWVEGEELKGLYIWIDKNKDGKVDAGELISVQEMGIAKISTSHKNFVSEFYYTDGRKARMWDWWPTGYKLREVAPVK